MELLTRVFESAWIELQSVYHKGQLISERHMQAEFFRYLRADPEFDDNYKIYVEPNIHFDKNPSDSGLEGTIPDMVITNTNEIIAIVELKCTPLSYLPFEKDVTNLLRFNDLRITDAEIAIEINPDTGNYIPDKGFKIHSQLLLIYAALAKRDSHAFENATSIWLINDQEPEPPPNYLFLTAQVEYGKGITLSATHTSD